MRQLIVSMNVTLDGFLSGPHCEMDWHFRHWSADMGNALCSELQNADTVLMGRVTYDVFRRFATQPQSVLAIQRDMYPFFDMLNRYQKVVFSKTMQQAAWENTTLFQNRLLQRIRLLKMQPGKNMLLYGSAGLLRSLQKHQIVDEYQLWIHPVRLHRGKPLFRRSTEPKLVLTNQTETFSGGVVFCRYKVQKEVVWKRVKNN